MAKIITYDPATNRVIAKGGTELDPIDFSDLFAADQAGGWGVVHDYGNNIYALDALLYLGDGYISTYFKDANKLVVFTDVITGQQKRMIYVYNDAHIQLGDLVDEETKEVNNGCVIQLNVESINNWLFYGGDENTYRRIYGCTIISPNIESRKVMIHLRDNTRLWHCTFVNYAYPYVVGNADIYRLTLLGGTDSAKAIGLDVSMGIPTINDFVATNLRLAVMIGPYSQEITISRMKAVCEKAVYFGSQNKDLNLIDCEFTNWIVYTIGVGELGKALRKYTVNIHVSDKDGANLDLANVVCLDKDDNEIFNVDTDAEGNIAEQEVTYQQWYQLDLGYHGEDEATCFSPHKFIILKDGYKTLTIDNITINDPIKWHLELQDPADYPAEVDVEKDVVYDLGNLIGTLKLPPEADVRDGEGYGGGGNEHQGQLDLPSEDDVEDGVKFDSETKEGNFVAPTEDEVKKDVGYGSQGSEFLGTFEPTTFVIAGQNLEGKLQTKTNLVGTLQKKVNMVGIIQRKEI